MSDDGSLYYLARGSGSTGGFIRRVSFGAAAPTITANPTDQSASPGGSATFNVTASGTPPLSYQWQRNNVNVPGATGTSYTLSPVQASDDGAEFTVVVTNSFGSTESQIARLTVLNTAPTGTIVLPVVGTTFTGGSQIAYSATASDKEDGSLPASAFSWRVDFHHDTHTHPHIPDTAGAMSGSFVIPTTGETSANVWYRIHLTVTDSQGLTHASFRDVTPRTVQITMATNPVGLQLTLDGQPQTAPLTFTGVVGMTRNLGATTPQTSKGTVVGIRQLVEWRFADSGCGNAGGEHHLYRDVQAGVSAGRHLAAGRIQSGLHAPRHDGLLPAVGGAPEQDRWRDTGTNSDRPGKPSAGEPGGALADDFVRTRRQQSRADRPHRR